MNMALHTAELYKLTKLSINIKNTEQISTYILTPVLVYINVTLFRTNIADKQGRKSRGGWGVCIPSCFDMGGITCFLSPPPCFDPQICCYFGLEN